MHGSINVKSPNNTSKLQMGFNSAFKGLMSQMLVESLPGISLSHLQKRDSKEGIINELLNSGNFSFLWVWLCERLLVPGLDAGCIFASLSSCTEFEFRGFLEFRNMKYGV